MARRRCPCDAAVTRRRPRESPARLGLEFVGAKPMMVATSVLSNAFRVELDADLTPDVSAT
jgi:hypothetical protein